jgi:hypothetical protein
MNDKNRGARAGGGRGEGIEHLSCAGRRGEGQRTVLEVLARADSKKKLRYDKSSRYGTWSRIQSRSRRGHAL